jgi:hypothetical protein
MGPGPRVARAGLTIAAAVALAVVLGGRSLAQAPEPCAKRAPGQHCEEQHEHGSAREAFIAAPLGLRRSFGMLSARFGIAEPHEGFKTFVANDDGRGRAWMIVLHQGTAGPKRATTRFHSLDLWMVRRRDRALLADVHVMADFGSAAYDCVGVDPPASSRVLPALGPGCATDYEAWTTQLSVGGRLRALGFTCGVDNPTTIIDPADPTRLVFNTPEVCGSGDPAGTTSTCKGDRRWIQHPRWYLRNRGPSVFYTDPYGRRPSSKPFPGSVRQFVRRGVRIDERRDWSGSSNEFRMANPADGGIFRPSQRTPSRGFDTTGAVHWPN